MFKISGDARSNASYGIRIFHYGKTKFRGISSTSYKLMYCIFYQ